MIVKRLLPAKATAPLRTCQNAGVGRPQEAWKPCKTGRYVTVHQYVPSVLVLRFMCLFCLLFFLEFKVRFNLPSIAASPHDPKHRHLASPCITTYICTFCSLHVWLSLYRGPRALPHDNHIIDLHLFLYRCRSWELYRPRSILMYYYSFPGRSPESVLYLSNIHVQIQQLKGIKDQPLPLPLSWISSSFLLLQPL